MRFFDECGEMLSHIFFLHRILLMAMVLTQQICNGLNVSKVTNGMQCENKWFNNDCQFCLQMLVDSTICSNSTLLLN